MPCKKKRHRLIAQLLWRHLGAVIVHRVHQQRKQIVSRAMQHLLFLDDPVNERIEKFDLAHGAPIPRRRPTLRQTQRRPLPPKLVAHQKRQRVSHFQRLARQRRAKQRSYRDHERQLHHFARNVSHFTSLPGAHMRLRALHHRRGIFINSAAVERRLRQPPLPPPEIAFADQQSLAEQRSSHAPRQFALVEFGVLHHEDLLDQIRIVEQDALLPRHDKTHEIAVLARHARQHAQGIPAHLQREPQKRQSLRPRRCLRSNYRHVSSLAGNHLSVGCRALQPRPEKNRAARNRFERLKLLCFNFSCASVSLWPAFYGCNDAKYETISTISLSLSCRTGSFINCVHGPLRAPVWISISCRVIWLGERPAIEGTFPRPFRSGPWQMVQRIVLPLPPVVTSCFPRAMLP